MKIDKEATKKVGIKVLRTPKTLIPKSKKEEKKEPKYRDEMKDEDVFKETE